MVSWISGVWQQHELSFSPLVLLVLTPSYAVMPELNPFLSIALVTQICVSPSAHLCLFPSVIAGERMAPAGVGGSCPLKASLELAVCRGWGPWCAA